MPETEAPTPWFILGSIDPSGRPSTERVPAPTAEAAIETLVARGHTEVKLLVDDPGRLTIPVSDAAHSKVHKYVTAQQFADISRQTSFRKFLGLLRRILAPLCIPIVLAIIALTYRSASARSWGSFDSLLVAFVTGAIVVPTLFVTFVRRGSRNFARLQVAVVHAEYEDVLRMLPAHARSLKRAGYTPAGIALSVERYRARALLGLNRRDEAFAVMDALEKTEGVAGFQYLMALSLIQLADCDFAAVLHTCDQAEAARPEDFMPHFLRAEILAYHLHRPVEAQASLDRALSFAMTDELRNQAKVIQAAIEIESRRPQQALALINEALPVIEWCAKRTPIAKANVAFAHTLRAIACGQLNDRVEARRSFKLSAPITSRYPSARELFERARRAAGEG